MNRPLLRGVAAFAATAMLSAALAKESDATRYTYPRIIELPESFDGCLATLAQPVHGEVERSAELTITEAGSAEQSSLPDGSPDWMKELSSCVLERLHFSPATRDGVPIKHGASLSFRFRAAGAERPGVVVVDKVGPLITAPRMRRLESIDSCFPRSQAGRTSRFVLSVKIRPDGSATELEMPVGSEPWHEKTARCIIDRFAFTPGSMDGSAVEAQAQIPIVLRSADGGSVDVPSLRSTDEELETAYRACYPPDQLSMTSAFYSFDILSNGRLANPKVAKSSGNLILDEAGVCILKMLEFTPVMQYGRAIQSSATWELPIRPPR